MVPTEGEPLMSALADTPTWSDASLRGFLHGLPGVDQVGAQAKAKRPDPADPTAPMVAAVCVYPDLAHIAAAELKGSGVHVASVATAFPSGRASLEVKLADVKYAVAAGADEVDMVIDRGAFLSGQYLAVSEEIAAVRDACDSAALPGSARGAHLKVILETGELVTLDNVRRASWLAMLAGP